MSVKRRDNKNRVLRNGESQRADGRYVYVYVDGNGKQKFLYSWKLENTDKLPYGKRECMSLRDKIKFLNRDLNDGIVSQGGNIIEDTKTKSGTRFVPMTDEVVECFKRIIHNRKKPKVEPMIDGYSGFLFLDKNDMPEVALHWEKHFEWALQKYNRTYKVQLPKITPHVRRHTFCSNMAKGGMNPKTLQYIMGHSDIGVTLNTYTHLGIDDAEEEMKKVCNA